MMLRMLFRPSTPGLRRSLLIFSLAVPIIGCRQETATPASARLPALAVRVQMIQPQQHLATEEVMGTVRARSRATVEAKFSGRIDKMLVAPGQAVKAGELLVQLDAREIQARLDQALALREQLGRDADRLRLLLKDNAVSRQEFELIESRHRVAVASVTEAETMLGYARVTAPFNAVVTRKLADVGDLAAPGKALLELEEPSALRLEADVPEALISHVRLGDKLAIRVAALSSTLEGTVSEIAPAADSASRTFLVKLDLPPATALRSGQFARVAVPVDETSALRVPASAIVQRGQMELVFVETNRVAQLRLVKTGKRVGGEVELISGVEAGERVVTEGAAQLRDGQVVEVKP
jgi:membrane fusion protein, multidrug efflux system